MLLQFKLLHDLHSYKNSNTAVVLGSGNSINTITPEEWCWFKQQDLWAMNNWVYHPTVVPNFYMIECKHYNYKLMQRRLCEKSDAYSDTTFLFPQNKMIRMPDMRVLPLRDVVGKQHRVFELPLQTREPKRKVKVFDAGYEIHPTKLTKSYDMSITVLFELLLRLDYECIVLCGIDLHNSKYFWSDGDPVWGEVHHQWNKQHEGKSPQAPHATVRIKDFIVDFYNRWMSPDGDMFVHNKTSLLYPEIPYFRLRDHENEGLDCNSTERCEQLDG